MKVNGVEIIAGEKNMDFNECYLNRDFDDLWTGHDFLERYKYEEAVTNKKHMLSFQSWKERFIQTNHFKRATKADIERIKTRECKE